ncbi:MAG: GIY-YIG nuclease family protein [Ruminococcus sp.]|nr:GIY-YIG nuclease family protein [Ruminococcus sp.]
MDSKKGVIYILTNPSFPEFVKIGYADDIDNRLKQLNRSECVPFAFRVYATYEVGSRLSDLKIHSIIDKLNPNLRSIENFKGQKRVREFYAMKPEDAYSILEAIAEIHCCTDKLKLIPPSEEEIDAENIAKEIDEETRSRAVPFSFEMCDIPVGAQLQFWRTATRPTDNLCTVVDSKHVEFEGQVYSLSSLAAKLSGVSYSVHGPCYFKYNGEWLNDIRNRIGL